jgi:7-cyano-7-deazaguanine synthase
MCSVFGVLCTDAMATHRSRLPAYMDYAETWERAQERGRDSAGLHFVDHCDGALSRLAATQPFPNSVFRHPRPYTAVGNRRGEPTTEWVKAKTDADIQPFTSPSGRWTFTHNGTIANDRDILSRQVSADLSWEPPTRIDSYAIGVMLDEFGFETTMRHKLTGSFAILAIDTHAPDALWYAANYKPLFWRAGTGGRDVQITSQREYLEHDYNRTLDPGIQEVPPYSWGYFETVTGGKLVQHVEMGSLYTYSKPKVLVVCSGGLDSATVAWKYYKDGADVTLWHLQYGAKAEGPEIYSVAALASAMNAEAVFLETDFFTKSATSVLTDDTKAVNKSTGGADGAEFAHEWVPARNTVMMALAFAYAESHGHNIIALGTNLEESGAYPDNEPEFLNKLQALVPYALKAYHQLSIEAPVGNLMKREIVQLGAALEVPHDLTWSCYEGGPVHCGSCGPCFMRREAFRMAEVPDPTRYASQYVDDPNLGLVQTSKEDA